MRLFKPITNPASCPAVACSAATRSVGRTAEYYPRTSALPAVARATESRASSENPREVHIQASAPIRRADFETDADFLSGVDLLPKPANKPALPTAQPLQLFDILSADQASGEASKQDFLLLLQEAEEVASGPAFSPGRSWQAAFLNATTTAGKIQQQLAAGLGHPAAHASTPRVVHADGRSGLSAASALEAAIAASDSAMAASTASDAELNKPSWALSQPVDDRMDEAVSAADNMATGAPVLAAGVAAGYQRAAWQGDAETSSTDSDWEDIIWNPSWIPAGSMSGSNDQPVVTGVPSVQDVWEESPVPLFLPQELGGSAETSRQVYMPLRDAAWSDMDDYGLPAVSLPSAEDPSRSLASEVDDFEEFDREQSADYHEGTDSWNESESAGELTASSVASGAAVGRTTWRGLDGGVRADGLGHASMWGAVERELSLTGSSHREAAEGLSAAWREALLQPAMVRSWGSRGTRSWDGTAMSSRGGTATHTWDGTAMSSRGGMATHTWDGTAMSSQGGTATHTWEGTAIGSRGGTAIQSYPSEYAAAEERSRHVHAVNAVLDTIQHHDGGVSPQMVFSAVNGSSSYGRLSDIADSSHSSFTTDDTTETTSVYQDRSGSMVISSISTEGTVPCVSGSTAGDMCGAEHPTGYLSGSTQRSATYTAGRVPDSTYATGMSFLASSTATSMDTTVHVNNCTCTSDSRCLQDDSGSTVYHNSNRHCVCASLAFQEGAVNSMYSWSGGLHDWNGTLVADGSCSLASTACGSCGLGSLTRATSVIDSNSGMYHGNKLSTKQDGGVSERRGTCVSERQAVHVVLDDIVACFRPEEKVLGEQPNAWALGAGHL